MRGRAARRSADETESGWLKVIVPHINIDGVAPTCLLSPELARIKAYRVYVLWLFTKKVCVRVREYEDAVIPIDRSELPARVARQARMSHRIHIARAHALANPETRRSRCIPPRRHPL